MRGPHHGRGKDRSQDTDPLGCDCRVHAARCRGGVRGRGRDPACPGSGPRPRLHRQAAECARTVGNNLPWIRHDAAPAPETVAGDPVHLAAAVLGSRLYGCAQADAPSTALGHCRLLGRCGVLDRRTGPAAARWCSRRDGGAVPAHAQCAGCALPVGGCRFPGCDGCHRHGAQHGHRPCCLCRNGEIRRLGSPAAQGARAGTDRRARRPSHERRHVRRDGRCRADGGGPGRGDREPPLRSGESDPVAQYESRFLVAGRP